MLSALRSTRSAKSPANGVFRHEGDDGVTYEEATRRLVDLARDNDGRVTAAQVEADEDLSSDPATVSAAARALGGGTNVFSYEEEDDGRTWFPFAGLVFSELGART
jgi:hypothetical protein